MRKLLVYVHQHLALLYLRWRHSPHLIKRFQNCHVDEVIYCVGSGPSLNDEDLSYLDGQVTIFVNGSYQAMDRCRPRAAYWIVQDHKGLYRFLRVDRRRFVASFRSCHDLGFSLLRPPYTSDDIILLPRVHFTKRGWPVIESPGANFSNDLAVALAMTPTVIFSAIQLACYMGAARIALVGVDMDYPPVRPHFYTGGADDHSRPFGEYETIFRPVFLYYHTKINRGQDRLVNCSCRTREDVLPKMTLAHFSTMTAAAPESSSE